MAEHVRLAKPEIVTHYPALYRNMPADTRARKRDAQYTDFTPVLQVAAGSFFCFVLFCFFFFVLFLRFLTFFSYHELF